jgi:hypothetical protein
MKKYVDCFFLLIALSLMGCNSTVKKDKIVGTWINENEKCKIELYKDFTFKSSNIPLDVENNQYLAFNKQMKMWQGIWSLEDKQLKLTINESYYYLNVNTTFFTGEPYLYVKLLDESGGEMIYFDKQ